MSISLDDFGTGYSSLLRLSSLPVDEIKIDRGFISAMSQGERAIGIVRALIDLAHTLGMPSIAEGVETAAEMRLLESLGCDGVQGWHVARPMPAAEVTTWLRERAARALAIVPRRRGPDPARGLTASSRCLCLPACRLRSDSGAVQPARPSGGSRADR